MEICGNCKKSDTCKYREEVENWNPVFTGPSCIVITLGCRYKFDPVEGFEGIFSSIKKMGKDMEVE